STPDDPDARAPFSQHRSDQLAQYVRTWFPGLDPEPLDATSCLFTSTTDEHFLLDRRGPFIVCSPCSGHGFKFVPAIGRAVRALADGAPAAAPWQLPR
ncbi:MAG: FAD-dependent oxidoreductase, partial [Actinomycetes bacterium]